MPRASNIFVATFVDGRQVLLSYGTPVAVFVPGKGYLALDHRYSVTTSRHVNQFTGNTATPRIPRDEFKHYIAPFEITR